MELAYHVQRHEDQIKGNVCFVCLEARPQFRHLLNPAIVKEGSCCLCDDKTFVRRV